MPLLPTRRTTRAAARASAALALSAAIGCAPEPAAPPPRPAAAAGANVLVYLVDTLRADRLGCYGYARPVSPAIDAFAAGAVLFEDAVAHSSWTRPTVTSVLTGMTPLEHGVRDIHDRLSEDIDTLPEILAAAGWATAGFSTNVNVSPQSGLTQGLADFELMSPETRADHLTRRVLAWLDGAPRGERPWFVYAHAIDPHTPYAPPAEERRRFAAGVSRVGAGTRADLRATMRLDGPLRRERVAELGNLYDAEVAATDRAFGELLDGLRTRGQYERTLVIFLSDHGEGFDEHRRLAHGNSLYAELLQVPLIVKPAGGFPARREPALARQIDVLPTALAALGLPRRALSGRDLLGAEPREGAPAALVDLARDRRQGVGLVTPEWKLIEGRNAAFGPRPELFSRRDDPREARNLAARAPRKLAAARRLLEEEMRRPGRTAPRAELDAETAATLRALGYL